MTKKQKNILNEKLKIALARLEADKIHSDERKKLDEEETKMQRACKHDAGVNFYPDPAGGSDSWCECRICGGDVDRNWDKYDRMQKILNKPASGAV